MLIQDIKYIFLENIMFRVIHILRKANQVDDYIIKPNTSSKNDFSYLSS